MSLNIGALMSGQNSIPQAQKALRAWIQVARLGDKWENVVFNRSGTPLPEQVVRIEFSGAYSAAAVSDAGVGYTQRGIIFGLKDHPTLPDLDAREFDTFVLDNEEYTITHVNRTLIGQTQCQFEVV